MNDPASAPAASVPSPQRRPLFLRRKFLLGVGAAFVIILLAALCLSPRDRLYDGRTIREWFDVSITSTNVALRAEADRQLLALGPEAVPFLVTRLERTDTKWEQFYERNWRKAPAVLRNRLPKPRPSQYEQAAAIQTLANMRSKAKSAVPNLLKLLAAPPSTNLVVGPMVGPVLAPKFPVVVSPSPIPSRPLSLPPTLPQAGGTRSPSAASVALIQRQMLLSYANGPLVQDGIIPALVSICPENPEVITAMLRQTNLTAQFRMAQLINLPDLEPAILNSKPLLRSTLESGTPYQRRLVMLACRLVIAKNPDLQDLVLKGLRDPDSQVQSQSLNLAIRVQAPNEVMAPALVEALAANTDGSFIVSSMMFPVGARIPANLRTEDTFTSNPASRQAMDLIIKRPRDEALFAAVEQGLAHTNARVRAGCVMTLVELGLATPAIRSQLEQRLQDASGMVRYQAATALWKVFQEGGPLMPFMFQRLGHQDEAIRWSTILFLETNPDGRAEVRRALEERVQTDASFRIRARSATALGVLGAGDSTTIAVLSKAAKEDEYVTVRDAASEALARLQGNKPAQAP